MRAARTTTSIVVKVIDPVSSFDMEENRIRNLLLIRERAEHLIGSNPDSRITVLDS